MMNRRNALKAVGLIMGGTLISSELFLTACSDKEAKSEQAASSKTPFNQQDVALLDEVAETIIPTTDTPGAKAAEVGAFISMIFWRFY